MATGNGDTQDKENMLLEVFNMRYRILIALTLVCSPIVVAQAQTSGIPHLEKHGTATRLVVDGKPFLILGGELLNSSSSSPKYMRSADFVVYCRDVGCKLSVDFDTRIESVA